jgi:hypothetical protein
MARRLRSAKVEVSVVRRRVYRLTGALFTAAACARTPDRTCRDDYWTSFTPT